jgi:hypothetical protein
VHTTTLKGTYEELFAGFRQLVDAYVEPTTVATDAGDEDALAFR